MTQNASALAWDKKLGSAAFEDIVAAYDRSV